MPGRVRASTVHRVAADEGLHLEVHRVAVGEGLHLQVRVHGARTSVHPPVVLVHGFMGSAEAWGDLPARLAGDRLVLVPDLPGHGASDAPTRPEAYAVPRMARAVGRAVVALAAGPVDWVGYSMGGRVVLAGILEGALSSRRLVLESASPGLADPEARAARRSLDETRAATLESEGMAAFVDAWLDLPLFASQRHLPPPIRARERARRIVHDPAALAACLRGGGSGSQASYWPRLSELSTPTLLLTGGLDRKFGAIAEGMARGLPRAEHRVVAGVGHAVHLEAPDEWEALVRRALDGTPPDPSAGP